MARRFNLRLHSRRLDTGYVLPGEHRRMLVAHKRQVSELVEGAAVRDAIIKACHIRLRPILMTSLATIIGLMPMALKVGEGSESYAPLARALIGGLSMSVLLTVILVPAGFYLAYQDKTQRL